MYNKDEMKQRATRKKKGSLQSHHNNNIKGFQKKRQKKAVKRVVRGRHDQVSLRQPSNREHTTIGNNKKKCLLFIYSIDNEIADNKTHPYRIKVASWMGLTSTSREESRLRRHPAAPAHLAWRRTRRHSAPYPRSWRRDSPAWRPACSSPCHRR